jgi:hypothetical protein
VTCRDELQFKNLGCLPGPSILLTRLIFTPNPNFQRSTHQVVEFSIASKAVTRCDTSETLLLPFNWWKLLRHAEPCYFGLPMTARQANRSHLLDIGLFGNFILADCKRARHDRSTTLITGVGGEMKVLLSHWCPLAVRRPLHIFNPSINRNMYSRLTNLPRRACTLGQPKRD